MKGKDGEEIELKLTQSPDEFAFEKGIINEETIKLGKLKMGITYEEIVEFIDYYMDIPDSHKKIIALWIIGTYFHSNFTTYPFLYINAMRGSGKTRLLNIISQLAKGGRGRVQTGITESTLFRMPKGDTLLLDECEAISSKEKSTLREYMNACYKRGGVVQRIKKVKFKGEEEWIPETFEPYKPIAMANIQGMDEILGDRCITLILEKSSDPIKTKLLEDFYKNERIMRLTELLKQISVVSVVSLRQKNYIKTWNDFITNDTTTHTTHTTQTTQTTQSIEEKRNILINKMDLKEMFAKINNLNVQGRNLELLFPLLVIAKMISQEVFEETIEIGKEIMESKKGDEFADSVDVSLYEFVSLQEPTLEFLPLKDLTYKFRIFIGEPEWVNEKWMGKAFKRLNLILNKRRVASGRLIMLNVAKAKEKLKIFKEVEDAKETV